MHKCYAVQLIILSLCLCLQQEFFDQNIPFTFNCNCIFAHVAEFQVYFNCNLHSADFRFVLSNCQQGARNKTNKKNEKNAQQKKMSSTYKLLWFLALSYKYADLANTYTHAHICVSKNKQFYVFCF